MKQEIGLAILVIITIVLIGSASYLIMKKPSTTTPSAPTAPAIRVLEANKDYTVKAGEIFQFENRQVEISSIWDDAIVAKITLDTQTIGPKINKGSSNAVLGISIFVVGVQYSADATLRSATIRVKKAQDIISVDTAFQIPDMLQVKFTLKTITMTHENDHPDLPLVDVVMKAENNGTEKFNGDFLQMFYLNESGQLRFATHGVSSYGDTLEPLSEKDITYHFHVSQDAKQFILLYGPYSFGSGINEITKSVNGFFIDFATHAVAPVPKEILSRATQTGASVNGAEQI